MTTPAWMPPQLPDVDAPTPAPSTPNYAPLMIVAGCVMAFGLGVLAWNLRTATGSSPAVERPLLMVDETLNSMVAGDWAGAYGRFDTECAAFSVEALQTGFEPVLASYKGHELNPLRRSDFEPDEIVLVFGVLDLGNDRPNPLRAELVYAGEAAKEPWMLCGLRIDEP